MNTPSSTCPECGAAIKPGTTLCSACLLSAGAITVPVHPVSVGVAALPCMLGDYRLLRKLGAGGMGIVYEADHVPSGRRLALKVLNQCLDNEEQRQRFLREGRLAATIDHPNSVYVFGTEEIDDVPVIAMELATGGTLRDEVKRRGPLPVREAVDAILGIIDGLEAAHARGILHRDMKPANCFLTGDGKAIVGDYGLSISQTNNLADGEQLTRSGMIMGTPAFSPPEQLRAQPLDQRADIYSTGGTLYYLLTGKAPVERTTPVETVAAVLEGRIPSVKTERPEISDDLSAVIARCLAPLAAARYSSYAELRQALLPFSSTAPEPAPLGLRFIAGLTDQYIVSGLFMLILSLYEPLERAWTAAMQKQELMWQVILLSSALTVLLYAGAEVRWAATPGKWLCGLRVMRLDGARPHWRQAILRAFIYLGVALLAIFLVEVTQLQSSVRDAPLSLKGWLINLLMFIAGCSQLLLFITSWRRLDRAALHDLATDTRVIQRRVGPQRWKARDALPAAPSPSATSWGPFLPGTVIADDLRCGYDPVLRRPVLLKRRSGAEPGPARRDCARAGRLRWLQGVVDTENVTWDAWQAPAGCSLPELLKAGAPTWSQVSFWLDDLSTELNAAQKDGTLPAHLSLDHIWITTDGRALLLDQAWPGSSSTIFATSESDASQRFLHHLGELSPATQRPLHADSLMDGLRQHISGHYQPLMVNGKWQKFSPPLVLPDSIGKQLREILSTQPVPDAAMLAAADASVHQAISSFAGKGMMSEVPLKKAGPVLLLIFLVSIALLQLMSIATSAAPLLMRMTGVAAVTEKQRPAKRTRMLWRWCIGWAPIWFVGVVLVCCAAAGMKIMPVLPEICQVWMPVYLLLIIGALLIPRRSLVDRLAGTWLVAR